MDDNQRVYGEIATPLIDLSLNGGLSSMFAYGQTGSGKTFTIQGILQRVAFDIFNRQRGNHIDQNGQSRLEIYVSFIQVLGNDASDLLKADQ
jgi:kinesin family protein 2/24